MDQDHPEQRIAELERQLAEQKRIAELERQLADAKAADRADPPTGWREPSDRGPTHGAQVFTFDSSGGQARTPTPDDLARPRGVTRDTFSAMSDSDWLAAERPNAWFAAQVNAGQQAGYGRQRPGRKRTWAYLVGVIVVVFIAQLVALIGLGAAPSSALWMSGIVCSSSYHLVPDNSNYTTPSGASGGNMSYQW